MKEKLIEEFNALQVPGMEKVTELYEHEGAFVNLEYTLPSGQTVKFWDDKKIYYVNQLCKHGSDRCFGLVGDESHLMVCEYGDEGNDGDIVVYKRRD